MVQILHIDQQRGFAILNKPTGIDTYTFVDDMESAVLGYFRAARCEFTGQRAIDCVAAVHRLDQPTSGCLAVGINPGIRRELSAILQSGGFQKTYLAVVHGQPPAASGHIDAPLTKQRINTGSFSYLRTNVDHANGKSALTEYEVLASNDEYSLLRLSPITGRTHQLRVHCDHLGCPMVGDGQYPEFRTRSVPLHLHAAEISIKLNSEETLRAIAPIPHYMQATLDKHGWVL